MRFIGHTPVAVTLRSVATVTAKPAKRPSRARRLVVGVAVVMLASFGLVLGGGLAPVGSGNSAHAEGLFNFCLNPDKDDAPMVTPWPGFALFGGTNSADVGDFLRGSSAIQQTRDMAADGDRRVQSEYFTANEWYGTAGLYWGNYSWSELNSAGAQGCQIANTAMNLPSATVLNLNNSIGTFSETVLSWVTTFNIVEPLFLAPGSILPGLIDTLKTTLFMTYLTPIVFISAIALGWRGLVKRQARESIQGVVWMLLASVAALTFLASPVYFVKGLNNFTSQTSAYVVTSFASASSPSATDRCMLPGKPSDKAVRMISCGLWDTFLYTPWALGQLGSSVGHSIPTSGVEAGGPDSATFRGDKSLMMVVLDTKTFNRLDVVKGTYKTAEGNKALREVKKEQWKQVATTVMQPAQRGGWALWSGLDSASRLGVGIAALLAQMASVLPMMILGFGMLIQQVIFVFLIILSPIFLTLGIHPGFGRKLALGWVEMIISTLIKRIMLAGLMGALLAYFGLVMKGSVGGIGSIPGVGWQVTSVMMGLGAIAVLVFRGKLLKRAGNLIDLNGSSPAVDTRGVSSGVKRFANSGMRTIAGGVGAAIEGGSFAEGAKRHFNTPNIPGSQHLTTFGQERQRSRGVAVSTSRSEAQQAERAERSTEQLAHQAELRDAARTANELAAETLRTTQEAAAAAAAARLARGRRGPNYVEAPTNPIPGRHSTDPSPTSPAPGPQRPVAPAGQPTQQAGPVAPAPGPRRPPVSTPGS